jgi:hypothetical protein
MGASTFTSMISGKTLAEAFRMQQDDDRHEYGSSYSGHTNMARGVHLASSAKMTELDAEQFLWDLDRKGQVEKWGAAQAVALIDLEKPHRELKLTLDSKDLDAKVEALLNKEMAGRKSVDFCEQERRIDLRSRVLVDLFKAELKAGEFLASTPKGTVKTRKIKSRIVKAKGKPEKLYVILSHTQEIFKHAHLPTVKAKLKELAEARIEKDSPWSTSEIGKPRYPALSVKCVMRTPTSADLFTVEHTVTKEVLEYVAPVAKEQKSVAKENSRWLIIGTYAS